MKRLFALVALVLSISFVASAQTTPNLGFRVPIYNSPNWNVPMNYNFTLMDELLAGQFQTPVVAFNYRSIFSTTAPNNTQCSASNSGQEYYYNNGLGITIYACNGVALAWQVIGFQNPMTSLGDLLYGGNSTGAPVRLGVGSNGQVLTVVGGLPTWQTSSASFPYPPSGIPQSTGTTWGSSFQTIGGGIYLPTVPALGSTGQILTINSAGGLDWEGSGSITYPASGVVTSTGSAFGTSLQTTGGGSLLPLVPTLGSNGQYLGINAGVLAWLNSPGFVNPMTTSGDLIYGGTSGVATRLAAGINGQVLTLSGGLPTWATNTALTNPMSNVGDVIYGTTGGAPAALAAGVSGQFLMTGGPGAAPSWANGFSNPMTATGDIIYGGSGGVPTRLAIGSSGFTLQSNGSGPVWAANTALTNPMSSTGDLITGGASGGNPIRLAAGTAGQVLTSNGANTALTWTTQTALANPMTSVGDLIVGGTGGSPTRLGNCVQTNSCDSAWLTVNGTGTVAFVGPGSAIGTYPWELLWNSSTRTFYAAIAPSESLTTVGDIPFWDGGTNVSNGGWGRIAAGTTGQILTGVTSSGPVFKTTKLSVSWTPTAATASSCVEQSIAVTGAVAGNYISINPPAALGAHIWIGSTRVEPNNYAYVDFCADATGGTPPSGTWIVLIF